MEWPDLVLGHDLYSLIKTGPHTFTITTIAHVSHKHIMQYGSPAQIWAHDRDRTSGSEDRDKDQCHTFFVFRLPLVSCQPQQSSGLQTKAKERNIRPSYSIKTTHVKIKRSTFKYMMIDKWTEKIVSSTRFDCLKFNDITSRLTQF